MDPFLFPDELDWHVQDGFCLTDLLGHYINTEELPCVLLVGIGPVVGEVLLPEGKDGFCVEGTHIDEVVVIGTDGREIGAEGAG